MKIGVFSDAHGMAESFDQTLSFLQKSSDEVFFLGDAIGYIPDTRPLEAWYENRHSINSIIGNHEEMLLYGNFSQEKDNVYQLSEIRDKIDAKYMSYIKSLPTYLERNISGLNILFCHGGPRNYTWDYIYPDTDLSVFQDYLESYDIVFMGNTHYHFAGFCQTTRFINVGSCGLPRGQHKQGNACLFDTNTQEIEFSPVDLAASAQDALDNHKVHASVRKHLLRYMD